MKLLISIEPNTIQINNYQENDYGNERTCSKYSGYYAQDFEKWSDQEIDDAFGGESDAYWNID